MSVSTLETWDEIEATRGRYVNGCLVAAAVLGFPALISSLLRAFQTGWHGTTYLHAGLYALVLLMVFTTRHWSVRWRATFTLGLLFAFALGSLLRWGLPGSGLIGLITFCVLVSIFLGARAGIYATILSLAVLVTLGTAVYLGIISYDFDIHWYATSLGAWYYKVPSMGLMVGLMIVAIAGVHRHLIEAVRALSVRTAEQAESNERLAAEIAERERTEKESQGERGPQPRDRRCHSGLGVPDETGWNHPGRQGSIARYLVSLRRSAEGDEDGGHESASRTALSSSRGH